MTSPLEVIVKVRPERSPEVAANRKEDAAEGGYATATVGTVSSPRLGPVGIAIVGPGSSAALRVCPQTLQNRYPASFTSPHTEHFIAIGLTVRGCPARTGASAQCPVCSTRPPATWGGRSLSASPIFDFRWAG